MAKITDIANIMAALKAYYPNYRPENTEQTAIMLMKILGDLSVENLQAAVLVLCAENRQFAPSAGEIRQAAFRLNVTAAGIPDAQTAYAEVSNMPASMVVVLPPEETKEDPLYPWRIPYRKLEWSHPFVEEVARMIGWPKSFPTSEPGVDRAQFVKFYETQLQAKIQIDGRLPAVKTYIEKQRTALTEIQNITKRLEVKP